MTPAPDTEEQEAVKGDEAPPAFFLPDFCATRSVLAVVLIAELVAIVLTLARIAQAAGFWSDLARTSLFLLWVALCSAAVLCYARPRLARLRVPVAAAISLGLLLAVTLAISEATFQIGRRWFAEIEHGPSTLFPTDHAGFLLRNLCISFIVSALALRYFFVAGEWRHNVEMKARLRIDALQARIRPHFLFNSMNTIAALTRSNPGRAEEAVEDLADLFRANLRDTRSQIPLKEELEVARIYQRIEQLRLGPRLRVEWRIESVPLDTLVPSLVVQPLLENAIYHGIEPLPDGGTVVIAGERKGDRIALTVTNPVATSPSAYVHSGNRIALDNIRERLELAYPGRARVDVTRTDGQYSVTLTFPLVAPPEVRVA
jgi:two-component system sensor histidine kinase AlgZ